LSSSFQLNDQIFDIPPKNIRIDRRSFNHKWQTLRTRSSVKSKSGFSALDIYATAEFTDNLSADNVIGETRNGYDKLRDIISQIRVTPFCYIENQFIRKSILGSNTTQSMAVAVKQVEILKTNEDSNVIVVNFHFCWFNYFPFTKDFYFAPDLMSERPGIQDPAQSNAWRLFYKAEQRRAKRTSLHGYKEIKRLDGKLGTKFNQFGSVTVRKYEQLEREVEVLRKLREQLPTLMSDREESGITKGVHDFLSEELGEKWMQTSARDVFGDMTTMVDGLSTVDTLDKVRNVLNNQLSPDSSRYRFITNEEEWKVVQIGDDKKPVHFKTSPSLQKSPDGSDKYNKEDTILLSRIVNLNFNDAGLIVQGISISFENILAMLPLMGHSYPSFQHIGNVDSKVTISFATTNEDSIKVLSEFYSAVEDQSLKYRNIPAGYRNIKIDNDLINMCGLEGFLSESLVVENVEGEPGTYQGLLVLIDNPITEYTTESFQAGQSFTSSQDLRIKLASILEKNLTLINNPFIEDDKSLYELRKLDLRGISQYTWKKYGNEAQVILTQKYATVKSAKTGEELEKIYVESSYYNYSGQDTEGRNARFAEIVNEYGKHLGELLRKIADILGFGVKSILSDLLLLKNDDIISIEKVHRDLAPLYEKVKNKRVDVVDPPKSSGGMFQNIREEADYQSYQSQISGKEQYEKVFEAYNQAQEAQSYGAGRAFGIEKELYEANAQEVLDGARSEAEIRLKSYINTTFIDWLHFAREFLDNIIFNKELLTLPQFEEVVKSITETGLIAGVDNYPDFPISEVISMLQEGTDDLSKSAYNKLYNLYQESGLALKNVRLSAFLDPDFYFYNAQNNIDDLIPSSVVNEAKDAIIKARKSQKEVEGNWFKKIYEKDILGKEKTDVVNLTLSQGFAEKTSKGVWGTNEGKAYKKAHDDSFKNYAMAPDQLTGSVGPAIAEAEQRGQPLKLVPIQPGRAEDQDKWNISTSYRKDSECTLSALPDAMAVRHRFDTEGVLDFLPPADYVSKDIQYDPNKDPIFTWPTPTTARRPTSKYGWRDDPIAKQKGVTRQKFHKGLDLAADSPKDSKGTPIYAAADGRIIFVTKNEIDAVNKGVGIVVRHSNGWVTMYWHLVWDPEFVIPFSNALYRAAELGLTQDIVDRVLTVSPDKQIGLMDNTGGSTGSHLHFQMEKNGDHTDPLPILKGEEQKQIFNHRQRFPLESTRIGPP